MVRGLLNHEGHEGHEEGRVVGCENLAFVSFVVQWMACGLRNHEAHEEHEGGCVVGL